MRSIREIIAEALAIQEAQRQAENQLPPCSDQERTEIVASLALHNAPELEALAQIDPELVKGLRDWAAEQHRRGLEERLAIKARITGALSKPAAIDMGDPEDASAGPLDAKNAARRRERSVSRWWEKIVPRSPSSAEEAAQEEEDRKNDLEAAQKRRIANRKADFHAAQIEEKRRHAEILKRGPSFGWLR